MSRFVFFLCFVFVTFSAHASLDNEVRRWFDLRDSRQSFDFQTYANFIRTHKDWPDSGTIFTRAEDALMKTGDSALIVRWFQSQPPVTDAGRLRYVSALASVGQNGKAQEQLRDYWRSGYFSETLQIRILDNYASWLRGEDHVARLQKLLWQNNLERAEKTLGYVSNANAKQAGRARIALQRGSGNALSMVSGGAANDDGVLFDLARYYRQRQMDTKAFQTLERRRESAGLYAALWWRERNLLVRRALEDGQYKTAYTMAKNHGFETGTELADAEWLAGWLSVTRLRQPEVAFKHFERMYKNVKTPISVARAAYWAGIAAEQAHNKPVADQWYRVAATHMNTFYGQLAAYALGNPKSYFAAYFKRSKTLSQISASGAPADLVGAARVLNKMGKEKEKNMFLRAALRVASERGHAASLIPVARELNSPSIALQAAKNAYEKGVLVSEALYPRPKIPSNKYVESALTLGITRQESLFDRFAQSPAGARGLMQLMPATARHTAKQAGINYNGESQLFEPQTNYTLGQAYLTKMLARYDGFVPLAAAAYNGGPGNVDKWLNVMGDPRKDPYSWVDWVERIPFYETRNYVQRVWESYAAYQYLFSAR